MKSKLHLTTSCEALAGRPTVQQLLTPQLEFLKRTGESSLWLCTCRQVCDFSQNESMQEDEDRKCSWEPKTRLQSPAQPPHHREDRWVYSAFAERETEHTPRHSAFLQLMQLSNFYCNWKTIHHRNFMVGLGKVLFTINDEIVFIWQYDYTGRMQNASMDPPKQCHQVPRV